MLRFLSITFMPETAARQPRLLFWPEWLATGAIALLDLVLARHVGLHLILGWEKIVPALLLFGAALAARFYGYGRTRLSLEYAALNGTFLSVIFVLTYVSLAMSGPLVDARFLALDRAMGFDWLSGYRIFMAHPWVVAPLKLLYQSPGIQGLYFCVLFGLMNDKTRMRRVFWLFLLALLLTCAGVWLFPAYGPFKTFGLESHGKFLVDMEHLRSGRNLVFALSHMVGVVCFPSFHTTLAIGYIYAFRRTGPIGAILTAANIVMLAAIPFIGGHYFVDMIAGAAVAFLCIAVVEWAPLAWREIARAARSMPEPAAVAAKQ